MGWGLARLSYLTPTQILSGWEFWTSTRGSGAETFDFVLTFVPLKNESLQRMYDWEFLKWIGWALGSRAAEMIPPFLSSRTKYEWFGSRDRICRIASILSTTRSA